MLRNVLGKLFGIPPSFTNLHFVIINTTSNSFTRVKVKNGFRQY